MEKIYEPREDSFFFLEVLRKFLKKELHKQSWLKIKTAVDIGTGSGILAGELAKLVSSKVYATDVNKDAIRHAKINIKRAYFIISDLLSAMNAKFDLIVFNPPYLPIETPKDAALDGGKHGYEVVKRFINQLPAHLNKNGKCLLLISSLTNPEKVEEFIKNAGLKFKILAQKNLFFEKLFVYLIEINQYEAALFYKTPTIKLITKCTTPANTPIIKTD